MTNKKGRFCVHLKFFEDLKAGDGVNLFNGMVVIHAESDAYTNRIKYIGIHKDFESVKYGEEIPEYHAVFKDGEIYPKWERV